MIVQEIHAFKENMILRIWANCRRSPDMAEYLHNSLPRQSSYLGRTEHMLFGTWQSGVGRTLKGSYKG